MKKIIIPMSALRASVLFAEQLANAKFPTLLGVHVEATLTHTRLSATNGHVGLLQLCVAKNTGVVREDIILPIADLYDVIDESTDDFAILIHADKMELVGTSRTVEFKSLIGNFPELSIVVPRRVSGELGQFDPEYMARFAEAARLLDTAHAEGAKPRMTVAHNGTTGASLVRFGDVDNAVGIVMALRVAAVPLVPPAWVHDPMVVAGEAPPDTEDDDLFGSKPVKPSIETPAEETKPSQPAKRTRTKKVTVPNAAPVPAVDNADDLL